MLREEEKDQGSSVGWKTFSRSVSWTERPPRKSSSNPQWNSKARACLPPLQPLSIARPSIEEWPRAGSDDLGVWPNPPTPGARPGSKTPRENSTAGLPPPEFECRKDKLAFFDKECSRILDHIYLGSDVIAKNHEILKNLGITHVLNCVGFICPEYFKNELVYKTLWLQDSPSEDITSILYDVFDYFEDVSEQNGRVLVHCCHGVSRSTSLVIAYLMWKEGQTFDDAFQHVKAARGVTNPNVGFACQLLQCQKRVHALPASPSSVLRMYRMAPHSPYDPLHLVPKMLCEPGSDRLDSRGAFIVHIPSALYIWTGKLCSSIMADDARSCASQFIRYERAKDPVIIIVEGEETFEFWNAFIYRKVMDEGCHMKSNMVTPTVAPSLNQRKIDDYDLDFDVFDRAIAGGIVPPCPSSEAGCYTCLPSRENGWNRLRRKFSDVKEFKSGVFGCDKPEAIDACSVQESDLSRTSSSQIDCQDSLESSVSPSTSDYSSSFSFSPSSSNLSDLSFVSAQASPTTLEPSDEETTCLHDDANSPQSRETTFASHISRAACLCSSSGQSLPSLAERRGSSLPPRMSLPSIDEESHVSENLPRFLEDDNVECKNLSPVKEPISDADSRVADGRNATSNGSYSQMIGNEWKHEDSHVHLETLGEKGFSKDGQIKIVKEGAEAVQLDKDLDSRIE